jgi:hypothetical protein
VTRDRGAAHGILRRLGVTELGDDSTAMHYEDAIGN